MPSQNQKALLEFLGPEYSMKNIDFELCIYRQINDHYDIEVSGTGRKGPASVYVWDIFNGVNSAARLVERHQQISDREELKKLLDEIVERYQKFPYPTERST